MLNILYKSLNNLRSFSDVKNKSVAKTDIISSIYNEILLFIYIYILILVGYSLGITR